VHQHRRLALGLQAVEHALHPQHLPAQHRLGQLERRVARHVEHRVSTCSKLSSPAGYSSPASGSPGARPAGCPPRGRQKLQRALPFFAGLHPLALGLQALGDPVRQGLRSTGSTFTVTPKLSSAPNQAPFWVAMSSRGSSTRVSVAVVVLRRLGDLLQHLRAVLARLARRDRISISCLSANRLIEPPLASTSLQSKWAPATVCTVRSV
jgi:hypothetical protein